MIVIAGQVLTPDSRSGPADYRERLSSVLERINREGKDIRSPHTMTTGSEFQAVYSAVDSLFDHIWLIMYELHPAKVRFSIGTGRITTPLNSERAIGMDGPAFQRAREGQEILRNEKRLVAFRGDGGDCSELIDRSLALISHLMRNWEKKRFAVLYGRSRDRAIAEIAEFLEITERSVYKNIRAGALENILKTVGEIGSIVGDRQENSNG